VSKCFISFPVQAMAILTSVSRPAKSRYPSTFPSCHFPHISPVQGVHPVSSGFSCLTKCTRIFVPPCAGYGDTGRVFNLPSGVEHERRIKSERGSAETTRETGKTCSPSPEPTSTKVPVHLFDTSESASNKSNGDCRICSTP
jgi:hypothetical protein